MSVSFGNGSKNSDTGSGSVPGYPGCKRKMALLREVVRRYRRDDVACAIYCFNSWGPNRSYQETALALNGLFIENEFGDDRIQSYEQFVRFCSEFIDKCPESVFDDNIPPVFGNEPVFYRGKYYDVYMGCGAEHEYFASVFLSFLDERANCSDETLSVLSYMDAIVSRLRRDNKIKIDLKSGPEPPSRQYWSGVASLFNEFDHILPSKQVISAFSGKECPIEKTHFVSFDNRVYPLFNASLLMDYVHRSASSLSEIQRNEVANEAIGNLCATMFSPEGSLRPAALAQPLLLSDGNPESFGLGAIVRSRHGVVFFIGSDLSCPAYKVVRSLDRALARDATFVSKVVGPSGQRGALMIKQDCPRAYVFYDSLISPGSSRLILREGSEGFSECTALDIACVLSLADTPEELFDFFLEESSSIASRHLTSFDGLAGYFLAWKQSNGVLLKGTEDRSSDVSVFSFSGTVDAEVFDWFDRYAAISLPSLSAVFGYPFKWHIEEEERGFCRYSDKGMTGSEFLCHRFESGSAFLIEFSYSNVRGFSEERVRSEVDQLRLVEDMLMIAVRELEAEVSGIAESCGGTLVVRYVPCGFSAELDAIVEASELGFAVRMGPSPLAPVEVIAKESVFSGKVAKAENRVIEMALVEAVLTCAVRSVGKSLGDVSEKLNKLSLAKKMVDVASIELPYHELPGERLSVPETVRESVGKEVSFDCEDAGIQPGYYQGKAANAVSRKIQAVLVSKLEAFLSGFDMLSVHVRACSACAAFQHDDLINRHRAGSFSCMDGDERDRVRDKAIRERENSRWGILAMRYLIETNLALGPRGGVARKCTSGDFVRLGEICFRLVDFLSNADMFYGEPATLTLVVEDNYITEIEEDDCLRKKSLELKKRQIDEECRSLPADGVDADFASKVVFAFEEDAGLPFSLLLDICSFLGCIVPDRNIGNAVSKCVRQVALNELLEEICRDLSDSYSRELIARGIRHLCLSPDRIRMDDGKDVDYVPFGRSKTRPDRYELKPIVELDGQLYFSPVSLALIGKRWTDGLAQRFIPCKRGYEHTYKATQQWKAAYEKNLEVEVERAFLDCGLKRKNVFRGLELHKKGNHPQDLGDYDGFAYDNVADVLWLVECKEMEKTETAFDYMSYQKRYFGSGSGSDGKLSKFLRRVEYVTANTDSVMSDLGLPGTNKTTVKPVVVTNKPFMDISLRFPYELKTIGEFRDSLGLS